MRPHGTQINLERRRRQALELLSNGLKPPDIAKQLGCSLSSVYYWNELGKKKGKDALKPKPVSGRPKKLDDSQRRWLLSNILLKGARKAGYSTDLWTLKRISEVIYKKYRVSYHPTHIWRILKALDWVQGKYKRSQRDIPEIIMASKTEWEKY